MLAVTQLKVVDSSLSKQVQLFMSIQNYRIIECHRHSTLECHRGLLDEYCFVFGNLPQDTKNIIPLISKELF